MKSDRTPSGDAARASRPAAKSTPASVSTAAKAHKSPATARKAPPKAGNPEPYAHALKTLNIEVKAVEDQLGYIESVADALRCTPGDFILAAALCFLEKAAAERAENALAMTSALYHFVTMRKVPSAAPNDLCIVHMGGYYDNEVERAAADRALVRLGIPTDSEMLGPLE